MLLVIDFVFIDSDNLTSINLTHFDFLGLGWLAVLLGCDLGGVGL